MPRPFSEHEKEVIQARLLEQGYKLFTTYGLKKTNVEEIALAAGISKGAFYGFYDSKEALFMDVIEQAEKRVRQEVLAVIDLPGPSPRARLYQVLKKSFDLFLTIPILQYFNAGDFELLFSRLPPEKLQEHMISDRVFFDQLIARCREAGIPIRAPVDQIASVAYSLVMSILHEDDLSRNQFSSGKDILLELVAAFCLGEVELEMQSHDQTPSFIKKE